MSTGTAVLLVEDHVLLGDALAASLRAQGISADLVPLDSREGVIETVTTVAPDLVLLDLELGAPVGDGSTLVRPFVAAGAGVLVVSASECPHRIGTAVEAGALDVVSKSAPFDRLLQTVVAAAEGRHRMRESDRQRILHDLHDARERDRSARAPFASLTPREQRVLRALSDGLSVASMARDWYVAEATVRSQVRGVLMKLGVTSQLEAVALARLVGWSGDGYGNDEGSDPPSRADRSPR